MIVMVALMYSCKKDNGTENATDVVSDVDGNTYQTITVGVQTWMAENLKTTKCQSGVSIPRQTIPENAEEIGFEPIKTPAYFDFDNNASTSNKFGKLYNGFAIYGCNVCPSGWRIPTQADVNILIQSLGGDSIAGKKMKSIDTWKQPNIADNSSGMSVLENGFLFNGYAFVKRGYYDPNADGLAAFWIMNEYPTAIFLYSGSAGISIDDRMYEEGIGVRCIKN